MLLLGAWRVFFALEPFEADLGAGVAFDHLGRMVVPTAFRYSVGPAPLFFVTP